VVAALPLFRKISPAWALGPCFYVFLSMEILQSVLEAIAAANGGLPQLDIDIRD
jgi:hypothetical protein